MEPQTKTKSDDENTEFVNTDLKPSIEIDEPCDNNACATYIVTQREPSIIKITTTSLDTNILSDDNAT